MITSSFTKKAQKIIADNIFASLATSDKKGNVWVSPLNYFYYDKDYNFYFISSKSSRHVRHIMENPNVAMAIFDSGARGDDIDGVQIKGLAYIVGPRELPRVFSIFSKKKVFGQSTYSIEKLKGDGVHRFIKVKTIRIYKTDYRDWEKTHIDKRIEVKLR